MFAVFTVQFRLAAMERLLLFILVALLMIKGNNTYWDCVKDKFKWTTNRDYFMVGERVRFLFTSCEDSQKTTGSMQGHQEVFSSNYEPLSRFCCIPLNWSHQSGSFSKINRLKNSLKQCSLEEKEHNTYRGRITSGGPSMINYTGLLHPKTTHFRLYVRKRLEIWRVEIK